MALGAANAMRERDPGREGSWIAVGGFALNRLLAGAGGVINTSAGYWERSGDLRASYIYSCWHID